MKYIAYCRKSTDEKDRQILSIEAQIAELTEFAKRAGDARFDREAKRANYSELFMQVWDMIDRLYFVYIPIPKLDRINT